MGPLADRGGRHHAARSDYCTTICRFNHKASPGLWDNSRAEQGAKSCKLAYRIAGSRGNCQHNARHFICSSEGEQSTQPHINRDQVSKWQSRRCDLSRLALDSLPNRMSSTADCTRRLPQQEPSSVVVSSYQSHIDLVLVSLFFQIIMPWSISDCTAHPTALSRCGYVSPQC